jgi:hypothetical protein
MCDKNGFTGIYEIDFQIIMDLWPKNIDYMDMDKTWKRASMAMIDLYNTCFYFRNLLNDPIYFQQFQDKAGYKMFDSFADINSLNNTISRLPMSTKNGNDILIKLVAGNVVSIPVLCKNYRIINACDCYGTMIEINDKGMVIDDKIIEIVSETIPITPRGDPYNTCLEQKWLSPITGCYISNRHIIGKTKCGIYFKIASIDENFMREFVPR